ncbi:MAG: type III-A CRISPR-associated protein Cas10/Csm1, partial [Clostridia bacterium]|nr:type III-A CRISPR-associated protein Cas10/Csm1 [Clostridia bacterium]
MNDLTSITIASLFHDVGKVLYRAENKAKTHSRYGAEFVKEYIGDPLIQEMVEYHHSDAIRNSNISHNSLAYIVYEADNIAAATDRRKQEGAADSLIFNKKIPLHSIFNVLKLDNQKNKGDDTYKLKGYDDEQPLVLLNKNYHTSSGDYIALKNFLEDNMKFINTLLKQRGNVINSILKLLESTMYYVPSSTNREETPDISLYDHSKLTAAIASCIYLYCRENQITDYRHVFFDNTDKSRDDKMYLVLSGDLSGIQDFIYTISSKGALKSLRGRSFLIEIMMENIIDEILDSLSLSRANLLYSGGGHFYILLPNTQYTISKLEEGQQKLNDWFLKKYGSALYIQMAWVEASADQLSNGMRADSEKLENKTKKLFDSLSAKLSEGKIQRYSKEQLAALMNPDSSINTIKDLERECTICGASNKEIVKLREQDETQVCRECKSLYLLGDKIARLYDKDAYQKDNLSVIVIKSSQQENDLELPSLSGKSVFLNIEKLYEVDINLKQKQDWYKRIYSVNRQMIGKDYTTNLWAGIYNKTFDDQWGLADFKTLAEKSKGIKRLGVLRADVDDLGNTFSSGFEIKNDDKNRYKYVTISRYAMLSRILSMFFKSDINRICQGVQQNSFIFGDARTDQEKNLVIVYSGG